MGKPWLTTLSTNTCNGSGRLKLCCQQTAETNCSTRSGDKFPLSGHRVRLKTRRQCETCSIAWGTRPRSSKPRGTTTLGVNLAHVRVIGLDLALVVATANRALAKKSQPSC